MFEAGNTFLSGIRLIFSPSRNPACFSNPCIVYHFSPPPNTPNLSLSPTSHFSTPPHIQSQLFISLNISRSKIINGCSSTSVCASFQPMTIRGIIVNSNKYPITIYYKKISHQAPNISVSFLFSSFLSLFANGVPSIVTRRFDPRPSAAQPAGNHRLFLPQRFLSPTRSRFKPNLGTPGPSLPSPRVGGVSPHRRIPAGDSPPLLSRRLVARFCRVRSVFAFVPKRFGLTRSLSN